MTVTELIQELSSYPKDMQMFIANGAFIQDSGDLVIYKITGLSHILLKNHGSLPPNILVIEFDDEELDEDLSIKGFIKTAALNTILRDLQGHENDERSVA